MRRPQFTVSDGEEGLSETRRGAKVDLTRNPDRYACGIEIFGPSNLQTFLANMPPYGASAHAHFVNALGDPTTGAGLSLLRERSSVYRADRIIKPCLIAQRANDSRVKRAESDEWLGRYFHIVGEWRDHEQWALLSDSANQT